MKHVVAALLVALSIIVSRSARANGPRAHDLGIVPSLDIAVAPLAAPSPPHPFGTLAMAWTVEQNDHREIRVGEWDLAAARFEHVERFGPLANVEAPPMRLLRVGESLVLASGGDTANEPIDLLRLDLALHEKEHLKLGEGRLVSLAANERYLALGSYEENATFQECWPYHVRLIDLATFTVVAAHKFDEPLCPWPVPRFSSHALRFSGDRLLVILAERLRPRVVRLALPSLAEGDAATVPIPESLRWGFTSDAFAEPPLPLAIEDNGWGCARLSADLRFAKVPCPTPPAGSPDEPSSGERVVMRFHGRTVVVGVRRDTKTVDQDLETWVIRITP